MLIWYLARGAGIAAFLMLSVATAVGAFVGRRSLDPGRRVVWQYLHRSAALTGVTLVVLHIATLLADSYANVGVRGLLPFGSGYRPVAVTFGVLSTYSLVAVAVTGALRSTLAGSVRGTRIWRGIHLSSYVAWASSALHFYLAGTDSGSRWATLVLLAGVVVVVAGVIGRLSDRGLVTVRHTAPAPVRPSMTRTSSHEASALVPGGRR